MHEFGLETMPKEQTTDGFHVMRAFWKRVQEWDCHCPYLWRLCLSNLFFLFISQGLTCSFTFYLFI